FTNVLPLISSTAPLRSAGRERIPLFSRSLSVRWKIFKLVGSPGSILFFIPSSPALSIKAKARYGLHAGSGHLSSTLVPFPRVAGMRIRELLFVADQVI